MSKHFINDPALLVNSALHSVTITNPAVAFDQQNKIIYRRPSHAPRQVSIVSGGGSGHEPSFASLVGPGLLSAAVAGTIFASPSTEQVRTAIQSRVDTSRGVLVTVMNYTGDVLNFGMAVEKARAAGLNVDMVVVGDDVGVGRGKAGKVGRRGIAGTVLVHKISGALAATGKSLGEVARVARLTTENIVSVGASLDHVHVPGRTAVSDHETLSDGEAELGMGIHNEPGSGRENAYLPTLVEKMLLQLLDLADKDRSFIIIKPTDPVILMVNNLGGVSVLELGGITAEVVSQLEKRYSIRPVRILSGTYMTSLNGLGFSITLLKVVDTGIPGASLVELLDAPSEATGWVAPITKQTWEAKNTSIMTDSTSPKQEFKPSGLTMEAEVAANTLSVALERLISAEPEITKYDTIVGDGDCGIGLKRGAEAVLEHISKNGFTGDVVVDLSAIVPIVENTMDGTSGALFAIFLNSLVHALRKRSPGHATPLVWGAALQDSLDALARYTPARPGDRTLVDALHPFVQVLASTGDIRKAADAARRGAEQTKGMMPGLGRSVYVGGDGYQKVPDPGAWGLARFFVGLTGSKAEEEGWEAI